MSAPTNDRFHTEGTLEGTPGSRDSLSLGDFENAEAHMYSFPPAPINMRFGEQDFLTAPALSAEDKSFVTKFYRKLEKISLETCNVCNRTWFNLNVRRNAQQILECRDCLSDRVKYHNTVGFIPLFGAQNELDPGPYPAHLPELTSTEEMLIA